MEILRGEGSYTGTLSDILFVVGGINILWNHKVSYTSSQETTMITLMHMTAILLQKLQIYSPQL